MVLDHFDGLVRVAGRENDKTLILEFVLYSQAYEGFVFDNQYGDRE